MSEPRSVPAADPTSAAGPAAVVRRLREAFRSLGLHRPARVRRHEPGDILDYAVEGVWPRRPARVRLEVERHVGGGYAGQVYRVKVLDVQAPVGEIPGLRAGGSYALKILVPVGSFGRFIRNLLYAIGFQGAFSLQGNPAAVRAGALWQAFIRRGAALRLGSERAVVDVLATLVDPTLGSCGEISEWVDGRMWRYEVDDGLLTRLRWKPGRPAEGLGSPEYRAKREFMGRLVALMHDMGAHELARQYEWWTLKSQPNAMKRAGFEDDPGGGLTAVDFRAGMALLPFLPQCPRDLGLIVEGARRGSLVQFDRGDIARLREFVAANPEAFADMAGALEALEADDRAYRQSLPDVAHHHVRLLTRPRLWKTIGAARVDSWEIRKTIDPSTAASFRRHPALGLLFLALGALPFLTPALIIARFPGRNAALWALWLVPLFAAPALRRVWAHRATRKHWAALLTRPAYAARAFRGRAVEAAASWLRSGRAGEPRAETIAARPGLYLLHLPLSILPLGLHRFLTDRAYFRERLFTIFVRPFRLFFRADERERWLREMVADGERKGLLRPEEAARILSQVGEPFIQKYLQSMAVHLATLFLSETTFLTIALVYVLRHPDLGWSQATVQAGLMVGALNLLPVSPGSLVRGFYVLGLMAKERNFRDYKIALGISFFKMVGYIAFPVQMAYRYPDLARFMAGHWATETVHAVPIFGERGAWLEHAVFDAFYNFPLSLGRRVEKRDAANARRGAGRSWAAPAAASAGLVALAAIDGIYVRVNGAAPSFGAIWWAAVILPVLAGWMAAAWSRRPSASGRMTAGALAGALTGVVYVLMNAFATPAVATMLAGAAASAGAAPARAVTALSIGNLAMAALWRGFIFLALGLVGAFAAELRDVPGAPERVPAAD